MWQSFYEKHSSDDFVVLGVAMDVQGAEVARPYYEQHGVTFPRLVDQENRLGTTFRLSAVPNLHVIDEAGLFRGSGLEKEEIEAILAEPVVAAAKPTQEALSLEQLAARAAERPKDAAAAVAHADALVEAKRIPEAIAEYSRALELDDRSLSAYFGLSSAHLAAGDKGKAAETLKRARKHFPKNWLVRKQIWALEHPDRFYQGKVDYAWQKEQLAQENEDSR